jgi:hypothetical protein
MKNVKEIIKDIFKPYLNDKGQEVLDPKPMYHDVGFKKAPSLEQKVRMMVAQQQAIAREQLGDDFEDENDFSDDDGHELVTAYQVEAMSEEFPIEVSPSPAGVSGDPLTPTTTDEGQKKSDTDLSQPEE